jgi:hypothetical protein
MASTIACDACKNFEPPSRGRAGAGIARVPSSFSSS